MVAAAANCRAQFATHPPVAELRFDLHFEGQLFVGAILKVASSFSFQSEPGLAWA
jgi:hypothetical protein